jgi:hypothetical protein
VLFLSHFHAHCQWTWVCYTKLYSLQLSNIMADILWKRNKYSTKMPSVVSLSWWAGNSTHSTLTVWRHSKYSIFLLLLVFAVDPAVCSTKVTKNCYDNYYEVWVEQEMPATPSVTTIHGPTACTLCILPPCIISGQVICNRPSNTRLVTCHKSINWMMNRSLYNDYTLRLLKPVGHQSDRWLTVTEIAFINL